MSVINATPLLAAAGGDYQISRSVRLRSSASAYFNRTPASASNQQTFTLSFWMKRGSIGSDQTLFCFGNGGSTGLSYEVYLGNGGTTLATRTLNIGVSAIWELNTTQVLRDPSAWYHIAIAIDTPQATSTNRVKMYVNGSQVTSFGTLSYPTQNYNTGANTTTQHRIGLRADTVQYTDGYLTEINFIDGQALTPSSFGETDVLTGVWKPKKYAGTYGTNGFYLNFSDPSAATAAAIGKDYSGNGNNWTPNNISVTAGVTYDSMIDTPTPYADGGNGRGNYCTLNPLSFYSSGTISLTNGNLTVSDGTSAFGYYRGTMACAHKSYHEVELTTIGTGVNGINIGLCTDTSNPSTGAGIVQYDADGKIYLNGSLNTTVATLANGDVVGITYDPSTGNAAFYKNNSLQATISTGFTASSVLPMVGGGSSVNAQTLNANFGQRPFAYTPPTGFKALNTQNLPEPTIKKGNQYFDATIWTGDGATTRSITNSGGMQPDFVWVKGRSPISDHVLVDSVRGANKVIKSNLTNAEVTPSTQGAPTSFNSSGFTLGVGSSGFLEANGSGYTYVGWQWKANGTAVTNTAGSITSTVSAGATQGFSVVTFTSTLSGSGSATIGHGLGVAPSMIIVKIRNGVNSWGVYHKSIGNTALVYLELTSASNTAIFHWNNTSPTSTVFTVGYGGSTGSAGDRVAYCFAEVAGFSKFGSYTGNGSTDGTFVFCGFRPAFLMIKRTDTTGDWHIHDLRRVGYNANVFELYPNLSSAEGGAVGFDRSDFTANGFKLRTTAAGLNASGGTYIFAAFAESPFKNALAR